MAYVSHKAVFYIFVHDGDALYAEFLEREALVAGPPQNADYECGSLNYATLTVISLSLEKAL